MGEGLAHNKNIQHSSQALSIADSVVFHLVNPCREGTFIQSQFPSKVKLAFPLF